MKASNVTSGVTQKPQFYLTPDALCVWGHLIIRDMEAGLPIHEQQASLLVEAGMRSSTGLEGTRLQQEIAHRLQYINYRRFESYWNIHLATAQHTGQLRFRLGTYWEDILARYMFDRKLRQLIFDALSRIEIALRTRIAHDWARETEDDKPQRSSNHYRASFEVGDFLSTVDAYYKDNRSEEALRDRKQYKDVRVLPIDLFVEYTTFGNIQKLLSRGIKETSGIVESIAANMGMTDDLDFFLSGISLLKDVRNNCAHQARVWNRRWLSKKHHAILKDSKKPLWECRWNDLTQTWEFSSKGAKLLRRTGSTAAVLTFCYQIMKIIAPRSLWKERLLRIIDASGIPGKQIMKDLGFANSHWIEHPLWQDK